MSLELQDIQLQDLLSRRDEIRQALVNIGDLRPGSLRPRYRRCGKPNCHCADKGDPGHGPHWFLSRLVSGRMHSRAIPADALEETRNQVHECRRLRDLTKELMEVSDQICQGRLAENGRRKAKVSKLRSRRRSQPKPGA